MSAPRDLARARLLAANVRAELVRAAIEKRWPTKTGRYEVTHGDRRDAEIMRDFTQFRADTRSRREYTRAEVQLMRHLFIIMHASRVIPVGRFERSR